MSKGIIYQHSFNIGHYYNRVEHLSSAALSRLRALLHERNKPLPVSWALKTQLQWTMTVNEWLNTSHPFSADRPISVGHTYTVHSNHDNPAWYMLPETGQQGCRQEDVSWNSTFRRTAHDRCHQVEFNQSLQLCM